MTDREIYASSNGDQWLLVTDERDGAARVKHVPAPASGGRPSLTEVGVFLTRQPGSPQAQALLQLIGTLSSQALEVDQVD